jgi:hypothetical protein
VVSSEKCGGIRYSISAASRRGSLLRFNITIDRIIDNSSYNLERGTIFTHPRIIFVNNNMSSPPRREDILSQLHLL